jgi:hypothetical protein
MEGKDTYILLAFALLCWRRPVASLAITLIALSMMPSSSILTSLGCVNGNPSNQGDEKLASLVKFEAPHLGIARHHPFISRLTR